MDCVRNRMDRSCCRLTNAPFLCVRGLWAIGWIDSRRLDNPALSLTATHLHTTRCPSRHCNHLAGGDELKDLDTVLKLCALEDWDAEVRLTLKEAAALRALEVFSVAHMEAAGGLGEGVGVVAGGLSREGALVAAAEALVEDLKEQLRAVCPFFAPEHRAAPTVAAQYDAHVSRQVAALHEHGLSDLELGDLFEVNRFLQGYPEEMVALSGGLQPRPELAAAAKACLQECMVKMRQQMSAWYESILGRAAETLVDGDGRPFTANPEDLFQVCWSVCVFMLYSAGSDRRGPTEV